MKLSQAPSSILMVRPSSFAYNPQTAGTNAFQQKDEIQLDISAKALGEFNKMVDVLQAHDIDVLVVEDTKEPVKPDAIFPNNWISFHEDGKVILYPMLAENRRLERLLPVIDQVTSQFKIT